MNRNKKHMYYLKWRQHILSRFFLLCMNRRDVWQHQRQMSCLQCIIWLWLFLFSGTEVRARAYVHPQYTTLRSGPVLYILFRSTIMVSMWSGSCWAVILSLLFAEFSAACLHRHRKPFEMFMWWNTLSPTASNQIEAPLVKTWRVE